MSRRISRPGVRQGYDRWSRTYDRTPNPLVALDRRYTASLLRPGPEERIVDAGCGTGAHLRVMESAGSRPIGVDFSRGMLRVARSACPRVPLVQADLNVGLPLRRGSCDAVLCALVSEHVTGLSRLLADFFAVLRRGGRLVFSAFHPELASAGIEANFEDNGIEYRLGAERYSVADYLTLIEAAGFRHLRVEEHRGDQPLADEVPKGRKYLGRPLLLTVSARTAI